MNTTMIKGQLLELRGFIKVRLGKLTNNRALYFDGVKDELTGKAKVKYATFKSMFARASILKNISIPLVLLALSIYLS